MRGTSMLLRVAFAVLVVCAIDTTARSIQQPPTITCVPMTTEIVDCKMCRCDSNGLGYICRQIDCPKDQNHAHPHIHSDPPSISLNYKDNNFPDEEEIEKQVKELNDAMQDLDNLNSELNKFPSVQDIDDLQINPKVYKPELNMPEYTFPETRISEPEIRPFFIRRRRSIQMGKTELDHQQQDSAVQPMKSKRDADFYGDDQNQSVYLPEDPKDRYLLQKQAAADQRQFKLDKEQYEADLKQFRADQAAEQRDLQQQAQDIQDQLNEQQLLDEYQRKLDEYQQQQDQKISSVNWKNGEPDEKYLYNYDTQKSLYY